MIALKTNYLQIKTHTMSKRKTALVAKHCVACGTCTHACPLNAISIYRGQSAVVDTDKCVGCGKCANLCPAFAITIIRKEAV